MNPLYKTIIICKLNNKSSRGYFFKEETVREFINSDAWADRKARKTALGVITHLERRKPEDLVNKDFVGPKDYMLVDKATVSTITDMFIEDGYWKCTMEIFDPDKFTGKAKENIMYVRGLIESGVKLKSSAGIDAYYNPVTKEGQKIYDFVGVDFTQAPDFSEGGIEE